MSSSKTKNKKPPRRRNLHKAPPRTLAVALKKDGDKRLPVGRMPVPTTPDDEEIPLVKAPEELGPANTEPAGIVTANKDTAVQRTPNMVVTDGARLRLWLCNPDATIR